MPSRLVILGSTGSIGTQALDVARSHSEQISVVGLAAHSDLEGLVAQAIEFDVQRLALGCESPSDSEHRALIDFDFESIRRGTEGVLSLVTDDDVDVVLNAIVGSAGLRATIAALQAGKRLALANKESLVVGGELVTRHATTDSLIPVDSEHSAIFQCLQGEDSKHIARLWLTASGGPFFGVDRTRLRSVTAEQALAHPTWSMGHKISIDSATLMNKGLEVIEAHHLFGVPFDSISVVIHPQSCVHSMVEFTDGSVLAHLGVTDMRIPIQYALSYPQRWVAPAAPVDFTKLGSLEFLEPDPTTFGCLSLAYEAGRQGGSAPVVLNAANEIAVAAFLDGECGFLDIERIVAESLDRHEVEPVESVEHIEEIDVSSRLVARELISTLR
ncbi:MAG: 1-deoxy-D-xylulose-5-phosphate reductoisomerase [Actinobacteria bacterium]|nr:1-deoxy-D-xylulose-5-phosphate reductoisomerase [Actinomycetota bacterium]